jgi:D-glycero-D-manno-heptose 1,7-bisphosphate phosphatase
VSPSRDAVFLDRDGVLNEIVERDGRPGSPRSLDELRLVEDVDVVTRLKEAGLAVFIITNQPDVARGHTTAALLDAMVAAIRARVPVDDHRACVHEDAHDCPCRKPRPGMILDLAAAWDVDLGRSFVVGDMWRDVEAARAAGCTSILLERAYNRVARPDHGVATLTQAVQLILDSRPRHS